SKAAQSAKTPQAGVIYIPFKHLELDPIIINLPAPAPQQQQKQPRLRNWKTVDTLYLYVPDFEFLARSYLSEGGSSDAFQINSKEDLIKASQTYSGVKMVVLLTHGTPGKMWLGDKTLQGPVFLQFAEPQFLSRDARVLFFGCNLGEGARG